MRAGRAERHVAVTLPGGTLAIDWGVDGHVTMTGPAAESFRGTFDWGDFA
jgi:diaminopimelate epimerase